MSARRPPLWGLLVVVAVGLAGCEPYMSLTDRVPTQTRQATALLPETPRFAGMVDLETRTGQLGAWTDMGLREQLRRAEGTRLGTFLDATGMKPEADLKAVYGTGGRAQSFSAVVFADLTPAQMDRYLDRVPEAGYTTTYGEVPVYHLVAGTPSDAAAPDTLTLGFVRDGVIAVAPEAGRVEAMVDRHQDEAPGLRGNDPYMTLVERVGHGSTAWLVGRDVLQTALRDSVGERGDTATAPAPNGAGLKRMLGAWADRMLGLDDPPAFEVEAPDDSRFERLRRQVREQAVSVTLSPESVEGEAYLTMRDETSASNVVDVSKGVMAAVRLSGDAPDANGLRGLLDDASIERDGPVVHAQLTVGREQFRQTIQADRDVPTARGSVASIRRANRAIRR
ncbi:hypothetical protein [Salinibacter altiplanensis]|uniref:hypothetical protein n=1 Tax=Salinibacter altiplanensis TaxID=1803181 RepID=UPI000C9FC1C0|nr:hypothetical protein [Salinibacter altiplanensis]